jgi:hypothetical protein
MSVRSRLPRVIAATPLVRPPSVRELELRLVDASLNRLRRQRDALLVEEKRSRLLARMAVKQAKLNAEVVASGRSASKARKIADRKRKKKTQK